MDKKLLFIFLILTTVFVALAWKFPFRTTSLVSNLEPGPDTFYYSVPAWNWVHGKGFKMEAYGVVKPLGVKPLYGLYLIPYFAAVNDVRVYFFANLVLGIISIMLLMLFVREVFIKSKYKEWWMLFVGLIWVTNFYVYNLPSLLMSENMVMPITILLAWLLVRKTDLYNLAEIILTVGLLWFSKSSNVPLIGVAGLFMIVKVIRDKYFNKSLTIPAIIMAFVGLYVAIKIAWPNRMIVFGQGDMWFSIVYFKQHFESFLKIFVGGPIRYLWYDNQLISPLIGYMSIGGLLIGLVVKKYRYVASLVLLSLIVNIVFFSYFYSAEGRYLSTLIPLYLIGVGIILEVIVSKIGKVGVILPIVVLAIYMLGRVNINGFFERRVTTLKRQAMNNLIINERPWNYMAVEEYNKFFSKKDDNCYMGSLLNYYYFHLVFNKNCNYLPISDHQDFGMGGMIVSSVKSENSPLPEYYKYLVKNKINFKITNFYGSLPDYYEYLFKMGKTIYISNYYGSADGGWAADFIKLTDKFEVKKETEGCLGNCSIYRLTKLKKI